ncbi:NADPH-dependent F420 reductase [Microlunatus capsulatus]|uniref:Dinucleotide-binding enzyme n=1 Tax=Microlunatus capsulatus TaxID=99117 RepID=A0ABS4Z848_9ACTN|nr:NAD(P)-binding domain-containing protein [Microlunatus capsulatus]MBP2416413.1 putative dinucleotide-binding enzyme [Microlunatus capsulatus]
MSNSDLTGAEPTPVPPTPTADDGTASRTLGLVGAGHIGSALARAATAHGWSVVVSNSRGPETLVDLVAELGDGARAATAAEAAAAGDLVVVTVPLHAIGDLPLAGLAGRTVVDTNNYYPQRDGHVEALDQQRTTSSQLLADLVPDAHVVKAFNHIEALKILGDAAPAGTPGRRALVVAGDDAAARAEVAAFVDEIGFDALEVDALAETWRIEPGTPGYGPRLTRDELAAALAEAVRPDPA